MSTDVELPGRLELTKEELWRLVTRYSCGNCMRMQGRGCAIYIQCKAGKPLGSRALYFRDRQEWEKADWASAKFV